MPYILAQAKDSASRGFPMLRALFFEFPADPGSWNVEDEYMFGSDLLVAPLMDEGSKGRGVYLPPGQWIDYQTGQAYRGGGWHDIEAGQIPVILLVKDNSVIPHVKVAQSTDAIDWANVELRVFSTGGAAVEGLFTLPERGVERLRLEAKQGAYSLNSDPLRGRVRWQINRFPAR
jgi:alpha-D-xyloside xylohydrolase